jgi:hypothetical protein
MVKKGLMKRALNEEELLFLALHIISHSKINEKTKYAFTYAEKLITAYIIEKHGFSLSNKKLEEKYIDLLADFILTESAMNNEVEVMFKDGKISFKEKGK